jgi:hypothetical protein
MIKSRVKIEENLYPDYYDAVALATKASPFPKSGKRS